MNRDVVIGCVVFLAALMLCTASAGADQIVLQNGKRMEATRLSVEGNLVYVTFASGQMQAYPVEEVDLEASGLIEETVTEVTKKPVRGIAAARSQESGTSGTTITDKDVDHVRPKPSSEDADEADAEDSGAAVALAIKNPKSDITSNMVNYTATVKNVGREPVANIMLIAKAVNDKGMTIGSGTRSITQQLAPDGEILFAMSFPFQGKVHEVKVTAQASLANFEFSEAPNPGAKGDANE